MSFITCVSSRNSTKQAGLQIRVRHWGDDQHILVNFLILGGMILEKPMFFYSDDLFFPKIKIIGGWRSNIGGGGMYPPIPPGFAALRASI